MFSYCHQQCEWTCLIWELTLAHYASLDYKSIWFILFPKLRMIYSVLLFGSVIHQCCSSISLNFAVIFYQFCLVFILFEVYVHLEHHSLNILIFVALPFEITVVTYFSLRLNERATLPCLLMMFYFFILIKVCSLWTCFLLVSSFPHLHKFKEMEFCGTFLSIFFLLLLENLFWYKAWGYCMQDMAFDTPLWNVCWRRLQSFVNNSRIEIYNSSLWRRLKNFHAEILFCWCWHSFYNFLSWG